VMLRFLTQINKRVDRILLGANLSENETARIFRGFYVHCVDISLNNPLENVDTMGKTTDFPFFNDGIIFLLHKNETARPGLPDACVYDLENDTYYKLVSSVDDHNSFIDGSEKSRHQTEDFKDCYAELYSFKVSDTGHARNVTFFLNDQQNSPFFIVDLNSSVEFP
jgi:hypothetical protein